jgi:hypothetical protein
MKISVKKKYYKKFIYQCVYNFEIQTSQADLSIGNQLSPFPLAKYSFIFGMLQYQRDLTFSLSRRK